MFRKLKLSKSQRGGVLLQIIFVLGILSAGFYFLVTQINTQKNVVLETDGIMNVRFTLHSLVDYAIFGLRQRYCFGPTLLPDPCSLTHPASSERILMSQHQADILNASLSKDPITAPLAGNLRLKSFERKVPLNRFPSTHPLYYMVEKISRQLPEAQFRLKVVVEETEFVPRSGQEIFLLITAGLIDEKGKDLVMNNTLLSLTSYATAFPRELGTFALMIPKNLYLDRNFDDPIGNGSSALQVFDATKGKSFPPAGKGLNFLSPVFVNENVFLPVAPGGEKNRTKRSTLYSPVTFSDRLYLGNGEIREGLKSYIPASPGGVGHRFWRENELFGGFQGGVSIDGFVDKGLHVLAGLAPSIPADASLMQKCILRNMVRSDVAIMKKSEAYGNLTDRPNSRTAVYRFGLTEGNSFAPQSISVSDVYRDKWGNGAQSRTPLGIGPVVSVKVIVGDRWVEGQLLDDGVFSLAPEPGSLAYQNKLENNLDVARNLSPPDAAAVAVAQAKLDEFLEIKNVKVPKLNVRLLPATIAGAGPQPHLMNLEVSYENAKSFIDKDGNLVNPRIEILAYDGTYAKGAPIGPANGKLQSRFDLSHDGSGEFNFADKFSSVPSGDSKDIPTDITDYFTLDKKCEELRGTVGSTSFGNAPWDADFSGQTRKRSWNFAGTGSESGLEDPLVEEMYIGGSGSPASFRVASIVGKCFVAASQAFVAGFYVCDELIIEPRNTQLRMIGTFIVSRLTIDPTALISGIVWSSIYHPQATLDLRNAKILQRKTSPALACSNLSVDAKGAVIPSWHPNPGMSQRADLLTCNAISLREKAANFRWTTVDPDCGIDPVSPASTTCKNRNIHFLIMEHARSGGL